MTATYDPTLSTPRDRIRFRIGDTVVVPEEAAQLTDEEISAVLAMSGGNEGRAALAAVRSLYARYSTLITTSVGDTSIQMGELADNALKLIGEIERDLLATGDIGTPYAGGISRSDKSRRDGNPDRVAPAFSRDGAGAVRSPKADPYGEWS